MTQCTPPSTIKKILSKNKLKPFVHQRNYQNKGTIYRMGEIFASCSSDKELISRVYKELKKLNTKGLNNPVNK
jgi:peptide methionine sulfoxide reductase MsrA